jgi:hypothetical protein
VSNVQNVQFLPRQQTAHQKVSGTAVFHRCKLRAARLGGLQFAKFRSQFALDRVNMKAFTMAELWLIGQGTMNVKQTFTISLSLSSRTA